MKGGGGGGGVVMFNFVKITTVLYHKNIKIILTLVLDTVTKGGG